MSSCTCASACGACVCAAAGQFPAAPPLQIHSSGARLIAAPSLRAPSGSLRCAGTAPRACQSCGEARSPGSEGTLTSRRIRRCPRPRLARPAARRRGMRLGAPLKCAQPLEQGRRFVGPAERLGLQQPAPRGARRPPRLALSVPAGVASVLPLQCRQQLLTRKPSMGSHPSLCYGQRQRQRQRQQQHE